MSVGEFWNVTLAEVTSVVEAFNKYEEYKLKVMLQAIYELGDVIGNRVSMIFSKENTVETMTLEKMHPDLFGINEEENDEKAMMLEAERQAQTRREFAQKWNPVLRAKYGTTQTPSSDRVGHQGAQEGNGESESGSQQVQE